MHVRISSRQSVSSFLAFARVAAVAVAAVAPVQVAAVSTSYGLKPKRQRESNV